MTDDQQPPVDNPESQPIKNNKIGRKKIILFSVALGLIATVIVVVIFLPQEQSATQKLYLRSIENAFSTQSKQLYGSFNVDSSNTTIKGELIGNPQNSDGRMRANIQIAAIADEEVPVTINIEQIAIEEKGKREGYIKYNSFSSPDSKYKQFVEDFFSPKINKWIESDNTEDREASPTSFENDGVVAAYNLITIFAPAGTKNEADQEIFFSAVNKHKLYEVSEEIENTTLNGVDARKIQVTVYKDSFYEFEKEVNEKFSDEVEFERFKRRFVDQFFGSDNEFSGNVYLDRNSATIIGVDFVVDLDDPIRETLYGTTFRTIAVSMFMQYDRSITIERPLNTITMLESMELIGN